MAQLTTTELATVARPSFSLSEVKEMGVIMARSGMFGMKTPEQAMALMLLCQAEGMHPAIAARDYHVIQGRPTLKADAMLARFQAAGGTVQFTSYTDQRVAARFSHPRGGSVDVEWTIEMARKAGLAGKDVWKSFPRSMLRSRVVSEGVRAVCPGVVVGIYTPEEVADMEPPPRVAVESRIVDAVAPTVEATEAEPVESADYIDADTMDEWLSNLGAAADLTALKNLYADYYTRARQAKDDDALGKLLAAKDARKAQLPAPRPRGLQAAVDQADAAEPSASPATSDEGVI